MPAKTDPLSAAFRCVCLHEALKLSYLPLSPWVCTSYAILLMASLFPAPQVLVLCLMVRLYDTWCLIPTQAWDSYYWCLNVDGGLLLLLLSGYASRDIDRSRISAWWGSTARVQLAIFYLASGFWKINQHFMDAHISCAPMFFLTLATTLGVHPSQPLARLIAAAAPAATIVGEMAIGFLMLAPRRRRGLHAYGVMLALLLHLGIALTPPPNNATPFAFACVVRLIVTAPTGFATAVDEVLQARAAGVKTFTLAAAAAATSTGVVYARHLAYPPHGPGTASTDPWVAAYVLLAVMLARGLVLDGWLGRGGEGGGGGDSDNDDTMRAEEWWLAEASSSSSSSLSSPSSSPFFFAHSSSSSSSSSGAATARRLRALLIGGATLYGFGGPLLGAQDLGASNMYSNLRMHGGSNHYLLPTDLLASIAPSLFADAFRTVRIEACTSGYINSIYPNEITSQMSPTELETLRLAGHKGRMFNAAKARILSPMIGAPPEAYLPKQHEFLKWTVPAMELRRLLMEAREQGEAFSLTYTLLDGQSGDEAWRRSGSGRTVTVSEDGRGGRSCSVCATHGLFGLVGWFGGVSGVCACDEGELALQPPPPFLARKFLVQQPYPIIGRDDEDPDSNFICFGP